MWEAALDKMCNNQNGKFFLQEQDAAEKLGESDDTRILRQNWVDKDRRKGTWGWMKT